MEQSPLLTIIVQSHLPDSMMPGVLLVILLRRIGRSKTSGTPGGGAL